MASLRRTFSKKELAFEDLEYLCSLLKINLPLSSCLELIRNRDNETILESIKKELDKGTLIEKVIPEYLSKEIRDYLLPLLKQLSFFDALSLSLSFQRKQMENEKELLKSIMSPILLLFFSMCALYLFNIYGLDSIFSLLKNFGSDLQVYEGIRTVIRVFIDFFFIAFLLVFFLGYAFTRRKNIVFFYIVLSKHFPNSLFHIYYSKQFVSMFLICIERGYKTKETLDFLKDMKSKPIISFLSFHIDEKLLAGDSLKDAAKQSYYDSSLAKYIKIAMLTNSFSEVLSSYICLADERIRKKAKRLTSAIQIVSYVFIGAIIIFVYQVLFLPMQAISNL